MHDFKLRGLPAIADWKAQMQSSPFGVANFAELIDLSKVRELESQFIPQEQQRDYRSTWGHQPAMALGQK